MTGLPLWPRLKVRRTRYQCLGCRVLVGIDQDKCEHCGRAVDENDRQLMREAYAANERKGTNQLITLYVVILLIIILVGVFA